MFPGKSCFLNGELKSKRYLSKEQECLFKTVEIILLKILENRRELGAKWLQKVYVLLLMSRSWETIQNGMKNKKDFRHGNKIKSFSSLLICPYLVKGCQD